MRKIRKTIQLMLVCLTGIYTTTTAIVPEDMIVFNDNGGWCWFQDERVILHKGMLIIGSVADIDGTEGQARDGNIEVTTYNIKNRQFLGRLVLHPHLQADDHNTPAFLVLPNGHILGMYAKHGNDKLARYRITKRAGDTSVWLPEKTIEREDGVTYSNLFCLSDENHDLGRIYNFYRGENWNPNFIISDDNARSWRYGGHLFVFNGRPYVKYTSNNMDTIHFITTEHHPRDYDTSIYHAYLRNAKIYRSDGTLIRPIEGGPIQPDEATRIFKGDKNNVAWTIDMHLDKDGSPYIAYSVQKNENPDDLRYRYARWDGKQWNDFFLAYAGTRLYETEADYSGLVALDPSNPDALYISTDADPITGKPLVSALDGKRHYEILRGTTQDCGTTWTWTPITQDSDVDNLRPIVPIGTPTVLLWLRGTYTSYTAFDLDVVGIIEP
ncbi:MAG: BNR-4 repeat-containing protein [Sedimentisphaerales bacterium]|nr:BNR-4 repeat-containing protein [Sedimentisphaerales bacterium]